MDGMIAQWCPNPLHLWQMLRYFRHQMKYFCNVNVSQLRRHKISSVPQGFFVLPVLCWIYIQVSDYISKSFLTMWVDGIEMLCPFLQLLHVPRVLIIPIRIFQGGEDFISFIKFIFVLIFLFKKEYPSIS